MDISQYIIPIPPENAWLSSQSKPPFSARLWERTEVQSNKALLGISGGTVRHLVTHKENGSKPCSPKKIAQIYGSSSPKK